MGKFFTTTEAAKFLGVSVRTLRRWVKSGKIKGKVGVHSPEDKFAGAEDKFPLESLLQRTNSRYKHFKKRRRLRKLVGVMKKKQVQRRLTRATVPCDKLSDIIFEFPPKEYEEIIMNHAECGCWERKGEKEVVTPFWLTPAEEYVDLTPLNAFDRVVLYAAISAYEQGYQFLSFKMMLSAMTGDDKNRIYSEQFEAIKAAVKRLMTVITIDLAPLLKAFPKYRKRHVGASELISPILPCKLCDVEINGQRILAIELLGESPLMTVAKLKQQLITYDLKPLAVPNQNNTPQVIVIKDYLLRRIKLMQSSTRKHGLSNKILFETLYEKCGLADADKWQKQDARKVVEATLSHFKTEGVIKHFEFERQGNAYRAIIIINGYPQIHSRKCK